MPAAEAVAALRLLLPSTALWAFLRAKATAGSAPGNPLPGARKNQANGVDGPGGIRRATVRVVRTDRMEPPAMNITMIGLDTAKSVFQVHAVDKD
ncbi:MAG: hypothetical protein JO110_05020, partial [Acetobacteraceae bacterium]|nr:hypothetical protein [Acetobacteraceae bacterium]